MSFLTLEGQGPVLGSAIINIWFRIPQTSLDKAREAFAPFAASAEGTDPLVQAPPMCGIVPIITFGPRNVPLQDPSFEQVQIGTSTTNDIVWFQTDCSFISLGSGSNPVMVPGPATYTPNGHVADPSFIGINCRSSRNILDFNFIFPTGAVARVAGVYMQPVSWTSTAVDVYRNIICTPGPGGGGAGGCSDCPPPGPPECGSNGPPIFYNAEQVVSYEDISQNYAGVYPERLGALPGYTGRNNGDLSQFVSSGAFDGVGTDITANHWHHLILSIVPRPIKVEGLITDGPPFPGQDPGKVDSTFAVYMALDDVNITGRRISYFMPKIGDPNGVLTEQAYGVFESTSPPNSGGGTPFVTCDGYTLTGSTPGLGVKPTYSFQPPPIPMGVINIPGDAETTLHCEEAELQIYNHVFIDTGITSNRRIFVSEKGLPVSPAKAANFLQVDPEVELHGSGNWKKGIDSGSTLEDFFPTGEIDTYRPSPNLYGKQGPLQ